VDVPEIEIADLEPRLGAGAAILDVRETDEVLEVRIPGVVHIPLMDIPSRIDEVPAPVFVVCESGGRSHQAAAFLIRNGLEATNVTGGTRAWLAAGLPHDSGPLAP
jgi:rhodanese-related sulfurtransferase